MGCKRKQLQEIEITPEFLKSTQISDLLPHYLKLKNKSIIKLVCELRI